MNARMTSRMPTALTLLASLLLALGLVYLAADYLGSFVQHISRTETAAPSLVTPPPRPYLLVRSTRPDVSYGKLLLVPVQAADGPAYDTDLSCERAAFAGSRGVCLVTEEQESSTHYAYVFNDRFERLHKMRLAGVPNRLRLSPDGQLAAISVSEHTHNDPLVDFIARTVLIQTETGTSKDLREFRYTLDGKLLRARGLGVWGVTFAADSNRFFATLEVKKTNYLVEGDVAKRAIRVLRAGVECPSLSPDNTRIVYKRRVLVDDDARLRLYDLQKGTDVAIEAEKRSIVDQVDWLDDDRVMYHLTGAQGADVWSVRVDGTEAPRIIRTYAYSPAIVR